MTRKELRDQLASFLATDNQVGADYVKADMIIALFNQYDPFKEALEFMALASTLPKGAQITTHWMQQTLARGGLSDTDRAFRERLIAHPPMPPNVPLEQHRRNVAAEQQAADRALQICRGCAFIDQDCLPDREGSCSKRKEKEPHGSPEDE